MHIVNNGSLGSSPPIPFSNCDAPEWGNPIFTRQADVGFVCAGGFTWDIKIDRKW